VSSEWKVDRDSWISPREQNLGPGIEASTNLRKSADDIFSVPDLLFGASKRWQHYDPAQFLDNYYFRTYRRSCDPGGPASPDTKVVNRVPYRNSVYVGQKEVWENCGKRYATAWRFAVTPKDDPTVLVYIRIVILNDADRQAAKHFLRTFKVVDSSKVE
jgi:hypothetical protein